MKNQINKLNMLKLTAIAAYLFTYSAHATTAAQQHKDDTVAAPAQELQILEEIKSGFNNMLADLGFPEVKHQAKKHLQRNSAEQQATEIVNATNQQLPAYKFKVVIAD